MAGINIFDKNGYLDWDKILDLTKRIPFLFCVTGRGQGKTYGILKKLVNDPNETFMYIRRTKTQYEVCCKPEASPFKALEADKAINPVALKAAGKDLTAGYFAKYDEDGKWVPSGPVKFYMSSLSCFANLRGVSFEDVTTILFDEFIGEPHEKPIKNMGLVFLNMVETCSRNRELQNKPPLKVICLANANDIGNPIFTELDLVSKADKMMKSKQSISIDEKRGVCLIMLDHSPISERKKHTALYKLTAGSSSEFNQMALENRFYEDESAVIKPQKLPGEWIPLCRINGITIYKHKTNRTFYVSTYSTGTCKQFGSSYAEKKRFLNHFLYLWTAYLRNQVMFEQYYCLVLYENAFDSSK